MAQQLTLTTRQQLAADGVYLYDNTMLREYERCPYAFWLRFERNLLPVSQPPNYGLLFGQAIHSALESWYGDRDESKALDVFHKAFKDHEEQPSVSGKTGRTIGATYTLIFGMALLSGYFRVYSSDSRKVVENETPLGEELAEGVFVMGILDKLLESKDGTLTFMDHKTSKYYNQFLINPNPQFMQYKYLCEKFTGQRVGGELDMLGVAKNKYADDLLRREPFDYSDDQMERWKRATLQIIHEIDYSRETGIWERRFNCRPYFRDCIYMPLCTSPTAASIEPLLERMYEERVWDPFEAGL